MSSSRSEQLNLLLRIGVPRNGDSAFERLVERYGLRVLVTRQYDEDASPDETETIRFEFRLPLLYTAMEVDPGLLEDKASVTDALDKILEHGQRDLFQYVKEHISRYRL